MMTTSFKDHRDAGQTSPSFSTTTCLFWEYRPGLAQRFHFRSHPRDIHVATSNSGQNDKLAHHVLMYDKLAHHVFMLA